MTLHTEWVAESLQRRKTNEADCNNLGLLWIREKVLALSSELSIGKAWSNNNGAEHDTPPLSRYSRRVVCSFHGAILPPTRMIQKYRATVYFIKSMHMVINNIYNTSTYIIRVVYLYDMHAWWCLMHVDNYLPLSPEQSACCNRVSSKCFQQLHLLYHI